MGENTIQIIPYYAHPHVHVVINDNTFYDETTGTPTEVDLPYSTLVITGADQGIDNTFVRLSELSTKKAIFGEGNFQKYGQASLQADFLFNGSTNVWFCRVLPDNATYANMILLVNYREGNDLDDLGQATGLKRMEVKFAVSYSAKPYVVDGAVDDDTIAETARSLETFIPDPQTGYLRVPIAYIRSIGRGKYGNKYSMSITRDTNAEKEYDCKMYLWSLVENGAMARVINTFAGSIYQTAVNNVSTLISDVLDQYSTGSCPVKIYSFEDNFDKLFAFYQNIVEKNTAFLATSNPTDEQLKDLAFAQAMKEDDFDPLFGLKLNTKTNEGIPYYKNYTVKADGPYVAPDLQVANYAGLPLNVSDWNTATVGNTVLVSADESNGGYRWRYTVSAVDSETGNISYDDGVENYIDDDQYDGIDITAAKGIMFTGGHDGNFQEITTDGVTRIPTNAEMKIMLAKEQVKACRGQKDKKILSPYRVDLDFIFDANYNLTAEGLNEDDSIEEMFSNSTVLTSSDYQELTVLAQSGAVVDISDINVKQALFDLNRFRNRNGMTIRKDMGAGCHLYLDCGLNGIKNIDTSSQLNDTFTMYDKIEGRDVSVDLGSYEIFDPYTGKRIAVTVDYFIAEHLVPHIMAEGLNRPFVNKYATMTALQRDSQADQTNAMIRDTFKPDLDIIDWDVKETLFKKRFNYYLSSNEGRIVQRACQNTCQTDASALLEESNCRILNTLKKDLEASCRGYLYDWNDPTARAGYTDEQMTKYEPWIGDMVENIDIYFDANEFEQNRMMMHCYVTVEFREIVKRIILEINLNRAGEGGA